ncbi:MAG TPA: hypothetical protein ENJ40_06975 [Thermosulfurimonas dismutans]|uniref:Uncharacterized protein n=1 Tax=Thermosulfurimonas dismutans TaxID=999894 RepID=A0A7C3GL30_9BACT|nr:hypothetical protein [Thermosulfurimonas dismutans]
MAEEVRATLIEMIQSLPPHLLERVEERFRSVLEEVVEDWEWDRFYSTHREEFRKILNQAKKDLREGKVSDLLEDL